MVYGAILKACRTRAGLSQEDLAHKLNINQSDVSKYENGTKEPPISIFQKWVNDTQTQEVMVAYLYGVDGLAIIQNVLDVASTLVTTVGTIVGGVM